MNLTRRQLHDVIVGVTEELGAPLNRPNHILYSSHELHLWTHLGQHEIGAQGVDSIIVRRRQGVQLPFESGFESVCLSFEGYHDDPGFVLRRDDDISVFQWCEIEGGIEYCQAVGHAPQIHEISDFIDSDAGHCGNSNGLVGW